MLLNRIGGNTWILLKDALYAPIDFWLHPLYYQCTLSISHSSAFISSYAAVIRPTITDANIELIFQTTQFNCQHFKQKLLETKKQPYV
jgi:hypothetical protein